MRVLPVIDSSRVPFQQLFGHVDLAQVPRGYLLEYATPLTRLRARNGLPSDSNRQSAGSFGLNLYTLMTARTSGPPRHIPDYLRFLKVQDSLTHGSQIALGVLAGKISRLKPTAEADSLMLLKEGLLYDVAGRTQSPYEDQPLLLAGLRIDTIVAGKTYSLILPAELRRAIGVEALATVQVDAGSGFQTISSGAPVSLAYGDSGKKWLQVRVWHSESSTWLQTSIGLRVKPAPATPSTPASINTFFISATNSHLGGWVTVKLADGNTTGVIQNPLIIVEGIDYGDLSPAIQSEMDWSEFNTHILSKKSISYYLSATSQYGGINKDVIFLDYHNSCDKIESNAELFQDVVRYVKAHQANPSGRIQVLGISMGGLVARYGLCQMIKVDGEDPQVDLLITQDSPHKGANLTMGYQALIQTAYHSPLAVIPRVFGAYEIMESDAVKEMLIGQVHARFDIASGGYVYENSYQDATHGWIAQTYQPMVTFANHADQPFRFVALSLGSECAIPLSNPGEETMNLSMGLDINMTFGGDEMLTGFVDNNDIRIITNNCPLASNGGRVSLIDWGGIVRFYLFGHPILQHRHYTVFHAEHTVHAGDGHIFLDGAPGGAASFSDDFPFGEGRHALSSANLWGALPRDYFPLIGLYGGYTMTNFKPYFCFIPLTSAIDDDDASESHLTDPINIVTTPLGNARRDFFTTESKQSIRDNVPPVLGYNFIHPYFTDRTAAVILKELVGDRYSSPCLPNCAWDLSITGSNAICPAADLPIRGTTYSIPPQPQGTSIDWYIESGDGTIVPPTAQGPQNSVVVNGGSLGVETVLTVATTFNGCVRTGRKVLTTNKFASSSSGPQSVSGGVESWDAYNADQYLVLINGVQQGNWISIPASQSFTLTTPYRASNCVYTRNHCQANYSGADLTNYFHACGPQGSRVGGFLKNPYVYLLDQTAKARFFVDNDSTKPAQGPFEAALFDERDNKVWAGNSSTNDLIVNIAGLKPAHYVLIAQNPDDKWTEDLFIVESGKQLTVSPNPARMSVDDSVSVDLATSELKTGPFTFTLADFGGQALYQITTTETSARLPLASLQPGTYQVIVSDQDTTWSEDIDFLYRTAPYMTVSPNPASTLLTARINDPVYTTFKADWQIFDAQGNNILNGTFSGVDGTFDVDVSNLPTGQQLSIRVSDGYSIYTKHFQVIH